MSEKTRKALEKDIENARLTGAESVKRILGDDGGKKKAFGKWKRSHVFFLVLEKGGTSKNGGSSDNQVVPQKIRNKRGRLLDHHQEKTLGRCELHQ